MNRQQPQHQGGGATSKTKRLAEALYEVAESTGMRMGTDPAESAAALLLASVATMVLNRKASASRADAADTLRIVFDAEQERLVQLDAADRSAPRKTDDQRTCDFAVSLVHRAMATGKMRGLQEGLVGRAMLIAAVTYLVGLRVPGVGLEDCFTLLRDELELQISRARTNPFFAEPVGGKAN